MIFALAAGGTLEDRPVYNKSVCFDPFPFPLCDEATKDRIRAIAEELDAHRKRVQAEHDLTLTGIYNVLEKLRASQPLTDKDKTIHVKGLVSILKQLHDDLDAAVFAAYAWPGTLTDAEILTRLVTLNAHRAAEEKQGIIRPTKLGMKNWMFFGSLEAGTNNALIYTLLANCRAQGIDPEDYLVAVLKRLPHDAALEEAAALTPARIAAERRARLKAEEVA